MGSGISKLRMAVNTQSNTCARLDEHTHAHIIEM